MSTLPIGDYALLPDCRSAALVGRDGSVDWLCFPRFDGPSAFARLLDDDAGHLSVRPAGEFAATRRYLDQTMALATTFTTATGVAVLTDALAVGRNDRGHALGAGSPGVLLLSAPVAPAVDGPRPVPGSPSGPGSRPGSPWPTPAAASPVTSCTPS